MIGKSSHVVEAEKDFLLGLILDFSPAKISCHPLRFLLFSLKEQPDVMEGRHNIGPAIFQY
jgi:hypothetical protein